MRVSRSAVAMLGAGLVVGLLVGIYASPGAIRPSGSYAGYGQACRTPQIDGIMVSLMEDEGYRRAVTLFLVRNELDFAPHRTGWHLLSDKIRLEIIVRFDRTDARRIFCQTAWAERSTGAIVNSLPDVAAVFRPYTPDLQRAYLLASCAVVERRRLADKPNPAWAADMARLCGKDEAMWRNLYRGR